MFDWIFFIASVLAIVAIFYFAARSDRIEAEKLIANKVEGRDHVIFDINGYCATGDPKDKGQLFPAALAKLETTMSDDIIYLGVNPITTGSDMSGMYIDLEELSEAVKYLENNRKYNAQ